MTESPEPAANEPEPPDGYLFPPLPADGPVEALEALVERKLETCARLGEGEAAEKLREASALARAKLQEILSNPPRPGS
ncbi:MAG: hypothetical protein ACUVYA_16100 [Planctomycetota bacterium]